ncbi:J domain-containing protein [Thermoflavimicrobium daqui]|nr:J domain-containing protein [Thermoflavimicrobium daqui]
MIWDILGIEPTNDISVIKKAYAKKLRIYHPEDDPEGYQKLREAFDQALNQAKNSQVRPVSSEEADDNNTTTEIPRRVDLLHTQDFVAHSSHPLDVFMQEVKELYIDFFARIQLENWQRLLDSDVVWDMEQSETLQSRLIFFLENHRFLPRSIWQLFDSLFHWSKQKEQLQRRYNEAFIEYMFCQITGTREMRYDFFKPVDGLDYDYFLELREKAQNALLKNDQEAAKLYLDIAYELYPDDPDLLRMQGELYLRIEKIDHALRSFNHILHIHPADLDALLYRARIRYRFEQFVEAIQDCEQILIHSPQHTDAQSLMGKCYVKLGNLDNAKQQFSQVLQKDLLHSEAMSYMSHVTNPTISGVKRPQQYGSIKQLWFNLLFFLLIFVRRSWVYFLFYFIVELFTSFPFTITGFLLIPTIWEVWRTFRVFIRII